MNLDEKKYVDVFVDFIKEGKLSHPSNDIEYEYVIRKIPPVRVNGFKAYLRSCSLRPELEDLDAYDRWYDDLTIDKIAKEDFARWNLLEEKVTIQYGWEHSIANNIYKAAKEYVNDAEKLNLYDNNLYVGYEFSARGIQVFFYAPKNVELCKTCKNGVGSAKVEVNNAFNAFISKAEKILQDYKQIANSQGIFIDKNISRIEVDKEPDANGNIIKIPDPDYYCGRCFSISKYDISSNINSVEGTSTFDIMFFSIVKDSYTSKQRPPIK